MKRKSITLSVLAALIMIFSDTEALFHCKNRMHQYIEYQRNECRESPGSSREKNPTEAFLGLLRSFRLGCASKKGAMARDDVPGDYLYFINLDLSYKF